MAEQGQDNPVIFESEPKPPKLSQLWQLPVLVVSLGLLGVGFYMASRQPDPYNVPKALELVQTQVEAGGYERARQSLTEIQAQTQNLRQMTDEQRATYHGLIGDIFYLSQRAEGGNLKPTHKRILEEYDLVRKLGTRLSDKRLEWYINSLVMLGQTGRAMEELAAFSDATGAERRQRLLRQIVELSMSSGTVEEPEVARLLQRLMAEPSLTRDNAIWCAARQAGWQIEKEQFDKAGAFLEQKIAIFRAESPTGLGELRVLLGQAYLGVGEFKLAEGQFRMAMQELDPSDPLNGMAMVGLGRVRFAEGKVAEADELFADAMGRYPKAPSYVDAVTGRAESKVRLGNIDQAINDYAELVRLILQDRARWSGSIRRVSDSLRSQAEVGYEQGKYENSIRFMDMDKSLYDREIPGVVLLKLGLSHERAAEKLAGVVEGKELTPADLSGLDKATRAAVNHHFELAGDYYLQHTKSVSVTDNQEYGESLWSAADSYDKAGMFKKAIEVFASYVKERPNDPRQLQAMHRLAQAYRADGQLDVAITVFQRLVDEHPTSQPTYESLVPLARAYMDKRTPAATKKAEDILLSIVVDHPTLGPASRQYREALADLGRLYVERGEPGDFEKGISRLQEVITRYGDKAGDIGETQYLLGNAYRRSVVELEKRLRDPLSPAQRAEIEGERASRLEKARLNLDKVVEHYETIGEPKLAALQKAYLRNSYFYRGDCMYDLGKLEGEEGAIRLYEKAVQRYENEPAALVGLIQIVNSYTQLAKPDAAKVAHNRAKLYLKKMSEESFKDLPMSRKNWQDWLDSTSMLEPVKTTAAE